MSPESPPGGAWRSRRVGVAQAMGNCALVHNLVQGRLFGPRDDRRRSGRTRCRAAPDRRGRVGVAHATRKCAFVRNISQAWDFEPADLADLQGLVNTPMIGARSGLESQLRAMAKLFNNAGDKPILPTGPSVFGGRFRAGQLDGTRSAYRAADMGSTMRIGQPPIRHPPPRGERSARRHIPRALRQLS
jgi:hypothetical protein